VAPICVVLGLVCTQKTWLTLVFLFSQSNKNDGKAFVVPLNNGIASARSSRPPVPTLRFACPMLAHAARTSLASRRGRGTAPAYASGSDGLAVCPGGDVISYAQPMLRGGWDTKAR
jgi:hypothetical protein